MSDVVIIMLILGVLFLVVFIVSFLLVIKVVFESFLK